MHSAAGWERDLLPLVSKFAWLYSTISFLAYKMVEDFESIFKIKHTKHLYGILSQWGWEVVLNRWWEWQNGHDTVDLPGLGGSERMRIDEVGAFLQDLSHRKYDASWCSLFWRSQNHYLITSTEQYHKMFGEENRLEFTQSKVKNTFCVTGHITIITEGKH